MSSTVVEVLSINPFNNAFKNFMTHYCTVNVSTRCACAQVITRAASVSGSQRKLRETFAAAGNSFIDLRKSIEIRI